MKIIEVTRIWLHLKGGLTKVFSDFRVINKSNYFHLPIAVYRSEEIDVPGRPMVQGANRREEGTKG